MKADDEGMRMWLDLTLRLRPGAFAANAELLLPVVAASARRGERKLTLPADALQGGDCGSLASHPAFRAACARAQAAFLAAAAKVPQAPEVEFAPMRPAWISRPGPDARLPFCGSAEDVFCRQITGLAKRLNAIGCRDVVLGLSGGLDSALALLVTVGAFRLLDLDLKGIHAYTMPGFGTTGRTRGNAERLAAGLRVKLETVDITPLCRLHFKDLRQPATRHDVTFENAQARIRTLFLMDKANQTNGLVIGTGDMSEIALGWCTYNGDHMSMFGVNAGVPKTVVREICAWRAGHARGAAADASVPAASRKRAAEVAAALADIVATPVSPELLPARKGRIVQITEDKVGPYELHDFFLWHFIRQQEDRPAIRAAAKKAFRGTYDAATVDKWLEVFFRRFHAQAFKRNCAPDGVRVFEVWLGAGGFRIPSDMEGGWV